MAHHLRPGSHVLLLLCHCPPAAGRRHAVYLFGAGFHPDLTGYENIFLQATILGVPRAEIWDRLESIKDFCELGKFLNSPVRHYSSGMFLRLAF